MRKNSIKNTRINSEVQRELSRIILNELKDPRISSMVSVMRVYVAPDLKTCKAYISVVGTEEQRRDTMEGLKSASGFIRREVAKNVNLRITPEIEFISDDSIEYGVSMSRRIDDVIDEDLKNQEGRIDTDEQYTG
ncbi:MAG: 30S ribosome-binding factor RbfA [Saccharofermentans sp.]|nr:30S ribosome-binding factor RbfA [Saccharofermentans sp.]